MNHSPNSSEHRSLDPDDWSEVASLGRRMVDDMTSWLASQRERPLHTPLPGDRAAQFAVPAPREGVSADAVYDDFRTHILPHPRGNNHPRFWGWVEGSGTSIGMLADLLASGMNSNTGFGDHAAIHVEQQVLRWMRELFGYSVAEGGGVLTSGCTMANLTGLTVARDQQAGWDVAVHGLQAGPQLTVYASSEVHSSVVRAVETLGLGQAGLRKVPVDERHCMRIDLLEQRIEDDRRAGMRPIAIVGNAGTVNVGAFDDLVRLAAIARRQDLWLHVDGAFGALAQLSSKLRSATAGIELADSVGFDFHKWLHVPYDVGCVLFRDGQPQADTFGMRGAYLSPFHSTVATGPINFMQSGLQMSRGFRALKAWMTIRHYGVDRLVSAIERNVAQAGYLADQVRSASDLELSAPVPLNIVNFRYVPNGWDPRDRRLDALNQRLLNELHVNDIAAPSHTVLQDRFVMRAAITNHRSTFADFDLLVREVRARGLWLANEGSEDLAGAIA